MQNRPVVSIIIVNYNGRQFLEWCCWSLKRLTYPRSKFEVIVVDNNSWDNSVLFLRKHHPWVRIIESKVNLGFAGGNNLGVREARGKYVVLLNNDTMVKEEWLTQLVGRMEKESDDVAVVNGKAVLFFPFISLSIDSDTSPKADVIAGGDFRPVGVMVERVIHADPTLQHLIHFRSGFYERERREQIGLWSDGHAKILIPFHPGADELSVTLTLRSMHPSAKNGKIHVRLQAGTLPANTVALDSIDIERKVLRWSAEELKKLSFFVVQNAGNIIFKNGYVRDIGSAPKKNKQVYELDEPYFQKPREIPAFCGVNAIIRRHLFLKLGGFDESFFMYYEDADLSLRFRRLGYKIVYEPKAVVHHVHSGSSGELSTFVHYHAERNHLAFIWKHFPWQIIAIQTFLHGSRWLISYLRMIRWGMRGSWTKYEYWEEKATYRWRIIGWLIKHLSELLKKRWSITHSEHISKNTIFRTLY